MTGKYFTVNAEGCSIRCKLYAGGPEALRTLIVYGHGFGGHKDNRAAERFAGRVLEKNKGVGLVCFDWPCHGDDVRKTLRLDDCSLYLRTVVSHLRKQYPEAVLFGYATSFGGYLFLKYMSENPNPFAATAFRCPAVNMYALLTETIMTEDDMAKIRKGKSAQVGFDRKVTVDGAFLESLRQADITQRDFLPLADELLILQGDRDEIVSPAAVRDFCEQNVIEYETIEGADHRFQDPKCMDRANARILAFFGLK